MVLDGVATNELGDVEGLLALPTKKPFALGKEGKPLPSNLTPLHVVYDVTPPSLITAVCTEASLYHAFPFHMANCSLSPSDWFHSPKLCADRPR